MGNGNKPGTTPHEEGRPRGGGNELHRNERRADTLKRPLRAHTHTLKRGEDDVQGAGKRNQARGRPTASEPPFRYRKGSVCVWYLHDGAVHRRGKAARISSGED